MPLDSPRAGSTSGEVRLNPQWSLGFAENPYLARDREAGIARFVQPRVVAAGEAPELVPVEHDGPGAGVDHSWRPTLPETAPAVQ